MIYLRCMNMSCHFPYLSREFTRNTNLESEIYNTACKNNNSKITFTGFYP